MIKTLFLYGKVLATLGAALAVPFGASAHATENAVGVVFNSCNVAHADAAIAQTSLPEYPDAARQSGAHGTAYVLLDLAPTGSLVSASILRSSGSRTLDRAAISAARLTSYKTEIRDCAPVGGRYVLAVEFQS